MKSAFLSTLSFFFISLFILNQPAFACTDFKLTAKDGTIMVTRSMEFGLDLQSSLRSSPRGRVFETLTPDGKPGLTWKGKYGYVFLDAINYDAAIEGMNEQGLSFEALYLPGLAQYQSVPAGQNKQALMYLHIGDWILSNFKTVAEVDDAIDKIYLFEQKIPGMGDMIFPLHFSVYDASGKGMILEYVGGKLHKYDNQIGILTNSPTYDWHLINLNNYVHLRPTNPSAVIANGVKFAATGQGFGMIGLPGDISPPSRFVKTAVLTDVVLQGDDAAAVLNIAEHIINNVDIPRGLARDPQSGGYTDELTQWVAFKDLTHKIFYYRTYNDMSLRAISLDKVDFSEKAPRLKMPIASKAEIQDRTAQFLQAK